MIDFTPIVKKIILICHTFMNISKHCRKRVRVPKILLPFLYFLYVFDDIPCEYNEYNVICLDTAPRFLF